MILGRNRGRGRMVSGGRVLSAVRWALVSAFAGAILLGCSGPGAPAEPAVAVAGAFAQEQLDPATPPAGGPGAIAPTVAPASMPSRQPTSTPSPTPTPTVSPTPTTTPSPTATPAPQAIRLTEGGCCTQPFWSSDGTEVRFIDRPPGDTRLGIWGAAVAQPGAAPRFVTERLEESLSAGGYLVETTDTTTTIERLADGQRWAVPARGRTVRISPDDTRIAWTEGNDDLPPDQQVTAFWVANLDGSEPRKVATLRRGGLSGWISEDALLVSGRERAGAPEQVLWTLPLDGSPRTELARAERLRGPLLSPSGAWVAYYVTFDADPARNGLWVVGTDGGARKQLPPELFGSYQWRGCAEACDPEDEALLIVPLQPEARVHELWQVQAATGDASRLTDPAVTPFKIANGDWRVSPDGRHVAYVEANDRNIWVLELPE